MVAFSLVALLLAITSPSPQAELDVYLRDRNFVGAALVGRPDGIIFARGYGHANRQTRIFNSPRTRFRITWLAEPFTSTALFQLAERRRLSFDDSICRFVPRCPRYWRSVTVRLLATNKRRIPNVPAGLEGLPRAECLERLRRYRFRNVRRGSTLAITTLLEYVVERASGQRYETYVQRSIFAPAGMAATQVADRVELGEAVRYFPDGRAAAPYTSGYTSTVVDYYRFLRALYLRRLVDDSSFTTMFSAKPGSYIPGYYGVWQYGWLIGGSDIGRIAADHAHGAPASVTYAAFYPDSGLVVLLFANRPRVIGDIGAELARIATR
jgi:CubicO group peptidase (beta-lactamase class C family)